MAFPAVRARNISRTTTNSTNHTVNLPADIVAGNLLIVLFVSDGIPTITFPEGWTELFQTARGTAVKFGAWYRIADGEEGATITVTTSASEVTAHLSYRITHYSGTPEVGTPATGTTDKPNSPSLTPTWGAKDTLWITAFGIDVEQAIHVYPADYAVRWKSSYYVTDSCMVGAVMRELNAVSEDPGEWDLSGAEEWVANTIAVAPSDEESSILRPNAGGTHTEHDYYDGSWHAPSAANNFQQVDEAVPDDYATIVGVKVQATWGVDTYNFPNPELSGTIAYVRVYARCYKGIWGGDIKLAVRTGGVLHYGDVISLFPPTEWEIHYHLWEKNPETLGDWTWDEINALEAGIALYEGGDFRGCVSSQVYVVVAYTPPPPPELENKSANMGSKMVAAGLI